MQDVGGLSGCLLDLSLNWTGGLDWWTDTKSHFYAFKTYCLWSYVETL